MKVGMIEMIAPSPSHFLPPFLNKHLLSIYLG